MKFTIKSLICSTVLTTTLSSVSFSNSSLQLERNSYIYEDWFIDYELEQNRIFSVGFDPYDITKKSNITIEELNYLLDGTNIQHLSDVLVSIEDNFGINSILMASLVALESGWGTSNRTNQNNYTGYAIYSDNTTGPMFSTPDENIIATAQLLSSDYVSQNGNHYTGPSIYDINTNYSSDKDWSTKIVQIANKLVDKYNKMYR